MITKLNDLKKASALEILACINEALETGDTKNFSATFGTDYEYTTLTSVGKRKGLSNEWHLAEEPTGTGFGTTQIVIDSDEPKERYNLNLTRSTKKAYEKFLAGKNYPFKHTSAALELYMKALENGTVEVTLK